MERYSWTEPVGEPPRTQLIENATHVCIAIVVAGQLGAWHWQRFSTNTANGIAASHGTSLVSMKHAMSEVAAGMT